MSKKKPEINLSTEEKIKEAACIVFTKKGYAATKTRDIAEQAGLNLALLNYYFRSKEKLFMIIMEEKLTEMFQSLFPILNDESLSIEQKIEHAAHSYIDMLLRNPDLPIFVLSELRNNPAEFGSKIQLGQKILKSHFFKQLQEQKKNINPFQLVSTFLGMLVFPFISKPVFVAAGAINEEMFTGLMEERKKLVPAWLKLIMQ